MDEDEYKRTYKSVNSLVCAFEKAILSSQCSCEKSTRIFIADRQAGGCASPVAQRECRELLVLLRRNAAFALKLTSVGGPLPHAKEMKVQCGGLLGIQSLLYPDGPPNRVQNVYGLVRTAQECYGNLDSLPFSEVIQSIARFQARRRPVSR